MSLSKDCMEHAGQHNVENREPLDAVMSKIPENQSGSGRHKCPYCAYRIGYKEALVELRHSVDQLSKRLA